MDVIYSVKHQKNHEELRYSLRSLKNVEHDKVFIAGDIPKWTQNIVALPKPKTGANRNKDVLQNLLSLVECPLVDEDILSMHDDFYILKPTDVQVYRGEAASSSTWGRASKATMALLKEIGCWRPISYEQHIPFRCEKTKLKVVLDMIDRYTDGNGGIYWRTIYGNYFNIGGRLTDDVKVRQHPVLSPRQTFVSSEDTTFQDHLRPLLEPLFPEKSIYEK